MTELPGLIWIIDFLENESIPYVVCGGLAAQIYGSRRKLNDIDIFVHSDYFHSVIEFGTPYLTYGPKHHKGDQWDLIYARFTYNGQDIEICNDKECKILDSDKSKWVDLRVDFRNYERHCFYGVGVKVMNKAELVEYKRQLSRDVDIEDITQISEHV